MDPATVRSTADGEGCKLPLSARSRTLTPYVINRALTFAPQAYASIQGWPNTSTVRNLIGGKLRSPVRKTRAEVWVTGRSRFTTAPHAACNDQRYMSIRGEGVLLLEPGTLHRENAPMLGGPTPSHALDLFSPRVLDPFTVVTHSGAGRCMNVNHKRGRKAAERAPVLRPPPQRQRPQSAVPVGYHCHRLDQNARWTR